MSGSGIVLGIVVLIVVLFFVGKSLNLPMIRCPNCGYEGKPAYMAQGCSVLLQ